MTATRLAAVKAVVAVVYSVQLSTPVVDLSSGSRDFGGVIAATASACSCALSRSTHALLLLEVVVLGFAGVGSTCGLVRSNVTAALHHQIAPAQLLAKRSTPTATML
jgi:hypothetical protein